MTRSAGKTVPRRAGFHLTDRTTLHILLAVPLVILFLVFVFPLIYSFYISLTDYDMSVRAPNFIGLQNYERIASDPLVWHSIRVTLVFAGTALVLQLIVGFALALLVEYVGFLRGLFRTLLTVPILLTPVVLGVIWRMMLNYDFGIVNYFVRLLGSGPKNWLQEPTLALPAIIFIDSWHAIPFVMLVLAAGLAALPRETFESAEIDGANAWQRLWDITIPLLRPVIMVVVVFRSYALLGAFDFVFSLTEGGPARATEVLSYHIYNRMFLGFQPGYSTAIAYILLAITLGIVLFFMSRIEMADDPSRSIGGGTTFLRGVVRVIFWPLVFVWNGVIAVVSAILGALAGAVSSLTMPGRPSDPGGREALLGRRARRRLGVTLALLVLLVWLAVSLFPVLWVYLSSLKEPQDVFAIPPKWAFVPTIHNYEVVLGLKYGTEAELSMLGVKPPLSKLPQNFLNSLTISSATTVVSLTLGTLAAYALVRLRPRRQHAILTAMLITRMIPRITLAVPIYLLWRSLGMLDTLGGLTLAYLSFSLPFTVWMMRGYLLDTPVELEEAALVDGCSRLGALVRIVLPITAPGLSATAIFTFIGAWNEFLFGLLLSSNVAKPVTVEILTYITFQAILFGRLFAAAGLILLPVVVFTLFAQRYVATGLTGGALKG